MKRILYTLMTAIAIVACRGDEVPDFDLHGVWVLDNIHVPEGYDYSYKQGVNTQPLKIFTDSTYFVAMTSSDAERFALTPSYSGRYSLINKGGGEYIYFEDGNQHQFTVSSDSTIAISDVGRIYEWRRLDADTNPFVSDIIGVAKHNGTTWDEDGNAYIFTKTEHSLRNENHSLTAVIMCIVLALALLAVYAVNTHRNKRRIEEQLRLINEEREERPIIIQEALTSVEDQFLRSDYYLMLRRQITDGIRLKQSDWEEIERQVNRTHPGFTSRLFNLHPMSQAEMQTSLLIKLRVPTTEIANTLNRDTSTVSSIRSRLFSKVFHKKGGAKDWDEFILSL